MKFKVDENLPVEVREMLIDGGHDAQTVVDEALAGAKDPRLATVAREERRTLVSLEEEPPHVHVERDAQIPLCDCKTVVPSNEWSCEASSVSSREHIEDLLRDWNEFFSD
jgi:hypothetical protein